MVDGNKKRGFGSMDKEDQKTSTQKGRQKSYGDQMGQEDEIQPLEE